MKQFAKSLGKDIDGLKKQMASQVSGGLSKSEKAENHKRLKAIMAKKMDTVKTVSVRTTKEGKEERSEKEEPAEAYHKRMRAMLGSSAKYRS